MDNTAKLHDLMAADLEIHKHQAKIMRRGNRMIAGATIALAIILACSIAGGWWLIQNIQAQNEANLGLMRNKVIMRI